MSTTVSPAAHVADLVLEQPSRARVFERFGIDYCCGGRTPLATACRERGIEVETVLAALAEPRAAEPEDVDWTTRPIEQLCNHIVEQHHAYLREELPSLGALVDKVARAHGDAHEELHEVRDVFHGLTGELGRHMLEEEQVLFPACIALEDGRADDVGLGSVGEPIRVMLHEHDTVAAGLARIRSLTGDYEPPTDGCTSYRAMLERLQALEHDTHRHVHEENNVLFPRATALEQAR